MKSVNLEVLVNLTPIRGQCVKCVLLGVIFEQSVKLVFFQIEGRKVNIFCVLKIDAFVVLFHIGFR